MMTPRSKRRFHAIATAIWAALLVPAVVWWAESVPFLVICSVYANLAGHWAAYEASTPVQIREEDN